MACGAHGFWINDGRRSALSFPKCKVMFHVNGKGSELQDLQERSWKEDRRVRTRGRRDLRDEIFRQTRAGAAPLLD